MRFRSITKHIKAQNWFAVAIDLVIVVIGVFIGIQVANWNDARNNAAELSASLQRLNTEVARNLTLIDTVLERYANGAADLEAGREALNSCAFSEDGQVALEALLFDLVDDVQPNFVTVALNQLAGESRYQDLLTEDFQQAFSTYAGRLIEEHEQLSSHYQNMWARHVNYHPAVTAYFPGGVEESSGDWGFKLDQPFETVCADPTFRTRFINTIGFYQAINRRLGRLRAEVEQFRSLLALELKIH